MSHLNNKQRIENYLLDCIHKNDIMIKLLKKTDAVFFQQEIEMLQSIKTNYKTMVNSRRLDQIKK